MFSATPASTPTAAAPAPAATPSTSTGAGSLSLSFGLLDEDLDDIKEQAAAAYAGEDTRAKKPKVNHNLFFDDDKGFKTMLKKFPKIKFHGKGKEFDDLALLLKHYDKWFKELYPHGQHFEDLVWKARSVLYEKEKDEEGINSDPKERLHMLRFHYKNSADSLEDLGESLSAASSLPEDVQKRIEANKKRALEIKERKLREKGESSGAPAEDDMEAMWAEAQGMGEEEEDPFGFGFDMGGSGTVSAAGSKRAATMEDEDPFGFGGGGFDDDDGGAFAPRPAPAPAPAPTPEPAPVAIDPEVAKRIADKRAEAMARKRKREEAVAQPAPTAPDPATVPPTQPVPATEPVKDSTSAPARQEGEDPFSFGGGFDDP